MSDSNADDVAEVEPDGVEASPAEAAAAPTNGRGRKPSKPRKKQGSLAKELPILVIVAVGLAFLIKSLFVQAFFIPSGSMMNTLQIHDRVLVNKLVYDFRNPHRGEVVVFKGSGSGFANLDSDSPAKSSSSIVNGVRDVQAFIGLGGNPNESDFIKRVIAIGGDTISCPAIQGNAQYCKQILVNGHALDETSYLFEGQGTYSTTEGPEMGDQMAFTQKTVAKGQIWVMGDHRDDSEDSRFVGTVPVSSVIGRAFVKVWPPSRIAGIGVPKPFQQNLAAAVRTGDVGAAPIAAVAVVLPVAGLRRRRSSAGLRRRRSRRRPV